MSDAYFAGIGSLGSFGDLFKFLAHALTWNPGLGRSESSFGQIWNQSITAKSLYGAQFSKVSLAVSPIADGWIWFGFWGVLLFSIIYGQVLRFLGKQLDEGGSLAFFAMSVVSTNAFFENSLVSITSLVSGGIKMTLFYILLRFIFENYQSKKHDAKN